MFVVEEKPKSIEAESYRTLRTNIQYSSVDSKIKSIVVTSANPQEGKSTVSGNLGLAFAQNGEKVIIVDCDLRKPSIHKKFKLSNLCGLSEVIIGKEPIENVIQEYKPNLHILPSGKIPPNPSEMISSAAMNNLLEELKENYDVIIIDSPPIENFTDGQILSTKADGALLVIKVGESKVESVKEAKNLLNRVGANIIGLVMNYVSTDKKKYYYYYDAEKGKTKKRKSKKSNETINEEFQV